MAHKKKRQILGQEIEFKTECDVWDTNVLTDGTKVRLRAVATSVSGLHEDLPTGEPVYMVNASNIVVLPAKAENSDK
jgi:hypothetical protein